MRKNKLIVAIDFDGVLCEYEEWVHYTHIGKPIEKGIKICKMLKFLGCKIVIFTCRLNGQFRGTDYKKSEIIIEKWLKENNVPYDEISLQRYGKVFADVYIDDRAYHFNPDEDEYTMIKQIDKVMGGKLLKVDYMDKIYREVK